MSTAVLDGCGLQDWIASTNIPMCLWLLSRLQTLPSSVGRDRWRRQIESSPLGDAADLMRHLELAFTAMVQASISKLIFLSQCRVGPFEFSG